MPQFLDENLRVLHSKNHFISITPYYKSPISLRFLS
jgi:hypothetical protein